MNPKAVAAQAWQLFPDTFAERASAGRWVAYPWLRHLSERLAPAIVNGGGKFIVSAPPQHGKSEFISHWLPTWFLNRFPDRKVILASYAADYAQKWGAQVRQSLTENSVSAIPMRNDTQSKKRFMTQAGGQMITAGIGGPITGEGAHLFIIDDPVKNWEEAMSPTIQQRNVNWYKSVARTRLQPGATVIILQTRWHEADLAGELESEGGWEVINFEALCEHPDEDPLHRTVGEPLCAARYDATVLQEIKSDLGEMIWSAMYQGAPMSQGGNIVQGADIRFYEEAPKDPDEVALFGDLTFKQGEENDYTVIEAWARKGPDIYLLAQIRARMGFTDQLAAFNRMVELYPMAFHKEIEEKANGAALIEVARATVPGLIANNPKTSKEARLAAVSPLYKSGNVYYPNPETHPWVKENVKEITKFPKAKHDDTVDVASMALAHLGRVSRAFTRLSALAKW